MQKHGARVVLGKFFWLVALESDIHAAPLRKHALAPCTGPRLYQLQALGATIKEAVDKTWVTGQAADLAARFSILGRMEHARAVFLKGVSQRGLSH